MFDDFKQLLSIFNALNVKYLVVGGYAVASRYPATVHRPLSECIQLLQ
jgi:hypothetical protein